VVERVAFDELPDVERIFVHSLPRSGALDEWLHGQDVNVYNDGHYPVIYAGNRTIMDTSQWWPADCEVTTAARAWTWLERRIQHAWHDQAVRLLATPGTTGRDLWMRTPAADDCPVMSDEWQELVRSTSGQGRIETCAGPATAPGLFEYDMRLAYAAVMRNMPSGEPVDVGGGASVLTAIVARKARCRALVTFEPPDGWRHVGIFGVHLPTIDGWHYPRETGRQHGPTWADGAEIELAVKHGWRVNVERALFWPNESDPLRCWSERLVAIMAEAERTLSPHGFRHVRSMVRAIMLHTVGAFHGKPHRVTRKATSLEAVPIGADRLVAHSDGSYTWRELTPAKWPEASHPEWSSHIWARCRVRLLSGPAGTGLLNVEPSTVMAIRTDAVYLTEPCGWDDGKPGRWVLKTAIGSPVSWPRNGDDVVALREGER